MKKTISIILLFLVISNVEAQKHVHGPKSPCRDASQEISVKIDHYENGNRQFQKIHFINNSSKAVILHSSYTYGNIRNRLSELGKILPGKETRINTPVDGNWYAIVMYLEDACKSCPNNQESMNESNNWNVSCMNELDDELCKKYFNNCH